MKVPPPHNAELESTILGAMLLSDDAIMEVSDLLKEIDAPFYSEQNSILYDTMTTLFRNGITSDLITVSEHLKGIGKLETCGGLLALMDLQKNTSTSANIGRHALNLKEYWMKRQILQKGIELQQRAVDPTQDALDLTTDFQLYADEIANTRQSSREKTPIALAQETLSYIMSLKDGGVKPLESYFKGYNYITGGYQEADYIVLAARPSIGKTAYILSEMRNMSYRRGIPTAIISLDSKDRNIMYRMLAMESGVEMRRLRRGDLSENALTCVEIAARKHTQSQLIIDDTPLRSTDIRNRLKRLKLKFGVRFVVIDFIQLVTPSKAAKNQSREREVAEASAALKEAAKEFDMTIVALSQLSRQVESRPDKRPMLSDLRDSGSLEQDADLVLFMHRPEYYGQKYFDKDGNESAQNQAEIIIAKGRDTGTGSYRVYFTKATAHFENLPDAQNNGHGHPAIVQDDSSDYPF